MCWLQLGRSTRTLLTFVSRLREWCAGHDYAMSGLARAAKPFLLKIFLSNQHSHAQIMKMPGGYIVAAASTVEKELRAALKSRTNKAACAVVGQRLAERATAAGVPEVHWDRQQGQRYHGRRAEIMEALRAAGIKMA